MNRRDFFRCTAGAATFGIAAKHANVGANLGINAPPTGFSEFNWIDMPSPIAGVMPYRGDQLISCEDGIYRLVGTRGPYTITDPRNSRLWVTDAAWEITRVSLWSR